MQNITNNNLNPNLNTKSQDSLKVKLSTPKGEFRRIHFDHVPEWSEILEFIETKVLHRSSSSSPSCLSEKRFRVQYVDEEGDRVSIGSQQEWLEALENLLLQQKQQQQQSQQSQQQNSSRRAPLVKLFVVWRCLSQGVQGDCQKQHWRRHHHHDHNLLPHQCSFGWSLSELPELLENSAATSFNGKEGDNNTARNQDEKKEEEKEGACKLSIKDQQPPSRPLHCRRMGLRRTCNLAQEQPPCNSPSVVEETPHPHPQPPCGSSPVLGDAPAQPRCGVVVPLVRAQHQQRFVKHRLHKAGYQLLTEKKDLRKAKECFEQLLRLSPNDNVALYNLACTHSLLSAASTLPEQQQQQQQQAEETVESEQQKALELLRKAVSCGFTDAQHIERDEDFAPLRARKEFSELLSSLKEKKQEEKEEQVKEEEEGKHPISCVQVEQKVQDDDNNNNNEKKNEVNQEEANKEEGVTKKKKSNEPSSPEFEGELKQLEEMGFCNRRRNLILLRRNRGNLALVIARLLQ